MRLTHCANGADGYAAERTHIDCVAMVYYALATAKDAKGRCDDNIDTLSAWAMAHAVADEVEVPCREVGLTIRIQNSEFRIS